MKFTLLFFAVSGFVCLASSMDAKAENKLEVLSSDERRFVFEPSAEESKREITPEFDAKVLSYLKSGDAPAMHFNGVYTHPMSGALLVGGEKILEKEFVMGGSRRVEADLIEASGLPSSYCLKNALWNLATHFKVFRIEKSLVEGINFSKDMGTYIWFTNENVSYSEGLFEAVKRLAPQIKEIGERLSPEFCKDL